MGVQKIGKILTKIDGAIREMSSLRSAMYAGLKNLRAEFEEATQDARVEYSTRGQLNSLIEEIDRAMDDDHRFGVIVDFLFQDENRLKAMLSSAERDDVAAFFEKIEHEWKTYKERQLEIER